MTKATLSLAMAFILLAQVTSAQEQSQPAADKNQSPAGAAKGQPADNHAQKQNTLSDFKKRGLRGALDGAFKSEFPMRDTLRTDRIVTNPALAEGDGANFDQVLRVLTKSHADMEEAYNKMQSLRQARRENDGTANILTGVVSLAILAAYILNACTSQQPERCAEYRSVWHVLTGILLSVYVGLIADPDAPYSWLGYLVPVNVGVIGPLLMKFIGWWRSTEPEDNVGASNVAGS